MREKKESNCMEYADPVIGVAKNGTGWCARAGSYMTPKMLTLCRVKWCVDTMHCNMYYRDYHHSLSVALHPSLNFQWRLISRGRAKFGGALYGL